MSLLSVTTSGTSSRGESTKLAMLVNGIHDPVVSRVVANRLVLRIHKNDLKVRVGGILCVNEYMSTSVFVVVVVVVRAVFHERTHEKKRISQTLLTRKSIWHPVLIGEWYVTHLTEGKRRVKIQRERERKARV